MPKGRPNSRSAPQFVVWRYTARYQKWAAVFQGNERLAMERYEKLRQARPPGTAYLHRPEGWEPAGDVIATRLARHARERLREAVTS